jgi:hypothetical protein
MASAPPTKCFDISGTSVPSLHNFLLATSDMTVRDALKIVRPHISGLTDSVLKEMLADNGRWVEQVKIACLAGQELKLALRIFTIIETPFNDPFYNKVTDALCMIPPLRTCSPQGLVFFLTSVLCSCAAPSFSRTSHPSPSCCCALCRR